MITTSAKQLAKPITFGAVTIIAYLSIVVITTPALPYYIAIQAAFEMNSIVIVGMGAGIGLQIYLSEKNKQYGCNIIHDSKHKISSKSAVSGTTSGITATSFFSFFSLVPLGCCGWWLYVLSLLPSVLGTGVSAVLILHSQSLAYLGLVLIFGFNGLAAYKYVQKTRVRQLKT